MKNFLFFIAIVIFASCNSNDEALNANEQSQEQFSARKATKEGLVLTPVVYKCKQNSRDKITTIKDTYVTAKESEQILRGNIKKIITYRAKDGYSYTLNAMKAININPIDDDIDDFYPCIISEQDQQDLQDEANDTCKVVEFKCCNQTPDNPNGAAVLYIFYPQPSADCSPVAYYDWGSEAL
ncbi:hypothetical protein [Tenacibaculum aiptasiae]|uniref:hypothetical protein n=1 Tax=Tenacibaculum aiptasiae TaxID=426481 RepID=UPI00232DC0DD|nr:hypothetical protein [Tenacibaculum aiptasiae]